MSAWLFYALVAPLVFSFANILDKVLRDKHLSTFTFTIWSGLSFFIYAVILPFAGGREIVGIHTLEPDEDTAAARVS